MDSCRVTALPTGKVTLTKTTNADLPSQMQTKQGIRTIDFKRKKKYTQFRGEKAFFAHIGSPLYMTKHDSYLTIFNLICISKTLPPSYYFIFHCFILKLAPLFDEEESQDLLCSPDKIQAVKPLTGIP